MTAVGVPTAGWPGLSGLDSFTQMKFTQMKFTQIGFSGSPKKQTSQVAGNLPNSGVGLTDWFDQPCQMERVQKPDFEVANSRVR